MILTKDGIDKDIRAPKVIERLKKEGWVEEGKKAVANSSDEIEALREEATALGIEFHPRTGAVKLKELIEAKKAE